MAISKEKFMHALNEFYSQETLFKLYNRYFIDWIAEGYIGSSLGLFEISLISENSNKQTFLDLMEQAFTKEETFTKVVSSLDDKVKDILEYIAWNGKYPVENKEDYTVCEEGYSIFKELKDEYLFFRYAEDGKKNGYLYINNDILRMIRKFLPKPKDYYIHGAKNIDAAFKKNSEREMAYKLSLYYSFYKQGNVNLSSSGKVLKESKRNMNKYCDIEEFYADSKDLDYLKTETIGLFFFLLKEKYLESESFEISNFKKIILDFLSGTSVKDEGYHYTGLYLNYLKGLRNIWKKEENIKRALQSIKKVMEELPDDGIVSVENIIKYITYRDEFIEIIDPQDVYDYVYINEANYGRTKIVNYEGYHNYVIVPFIKSVLFILSSLGVLEAHYNLPSASNGLYMKNGYLSKYDGLKYVKLTELGRFVLGRVDDYDFGDAKEKAEILLDDDRLIMSVIGEAPVKIMFLEKVSNKIGPNKFKFTSEAFLKGIENIGELKGRIEEFRKKISHEIPGIWSEFFESLLKKAKSIKQVENIVVLKIEKDKELVNLLGRDGELKKMILKAEDFHILLKEGNRQRVLEILKSYGYFVEV